MAAKDDREPDEALRHAWHSIAELVELEQRREQAALPGHRIAARLTAFYGSLLAVVLHLVWFGLWVMLNLGWLGLHPFDPFPFPLLSVIVALEAILLTTLVLMRQSWQARLADERAKMTLQMNAILEREMTEAIRMLAELQDAIGIERDHPERRSMAKSLSIARVAAAVEQVEQEVLSSDAALADE